MKKNGFTLIELLVSVALFSIIMVMALGALLSLSSADRRAETLKSAIDNITFALDSMSRAIRTGSTYDCGNQASTAVQDCSNGADYFTFLSSGGVQTYYRLENLTIDPSGAAASCDQTAPNVGCIERSINGGSTWLPITSPDIVVGGAGYLFHAIGTAPSSAGNYIQPKVIITVSGTVPITSSQTTAFNMQTSVTQRIYDQ